MAAHDNERVFSVLLAFIVAIVFATSSPWWWHRIFGDSDDFVGGCAPFNLHTQNQFDPVGTKIWSAPVPTADSFRGFSPNEVITVDGWVRTRTPYPTNTPPWNSDAWFHLKNGAGWVTFAGVRSTPTDPSDGNYGAGSSPAPLDPDCQGTYRS